MAYIAKGKFTEQTDALGNGQCVALVRALTGAPASSTWREDESVVDLLERNAYVAPGTAIATFFDGRYPNWNHGNHAAIFLGWAGNGIGVFHQWRGKAPHKRCERGRTCLWLIGEHAATRGDAGQPRFPLQEVNRTGDPTNSNPVRVLLQRKYTETP